MAKEDSVIPTPINNPPQAPQGTPGYGNTRRDFGSLISQAGGNLLASGAAEYFDSPALGQTISQLTEATTALMHERFWKSEFENFQQTYGQQYQQAAQQLWAGYNELEDSFGNNFDDKTMQMRTQAMQDLMSKVQQLDIQFMQNAAKFGHNPLIGNMANQLMQQRAQWMQSMLGAYGGVVNDAESMANLQKAQFQVSPEMQELTLQEKKAGIGLKQAQAGQARAQAGLASAKAANVGAGTDLPNVPAGKLPNWLVTNPKGKEILKPYAQQAEARYRERLAKQFPDLDQEGIERKIRMLAPDIRKEAVATAMQDILPADAYASVLGSNPKVSKDLLDSEIATDSPSIIQKYSQSELKELVKVSEGDRAIQAAEALVRKGIVSSVPELKSKMKQLIQEEVDNMVGEFSGSEKVKATLAREMIKHFEENWEDNEFLAEELTGEAPSSGLLGKIKKASKAAQKYAEQMPKQGL